MGIRITSLIMVFGVAYSMLVVNMYNIQIIKGSQYSAQAASLHEVAGILAPKRGSIYFTDKNDTRVPAAINKEYPYIYAVPNEIEDPVSTANILSGVVDVDRDELIKMLSKENDPYEPITKRASGDQIEFIESSGIDGVYIDNKFSRFYPLDNAASHLIGFSSIAEDPVGVGWYGLEKSYDDTLRGELGSTDGDKLIRPRSGEDIYLTIDRNIQFQAEGAIEKLVTEYSAEGGTIIVENPKTGAILAMVNKPDFNPNSYGEFGIETFLNPAVEAVYEPGSIFKVITMAAGIDSGKITPDTTYVDTGSLTLNGRTVRNWDLKSYGEVTMTRVIERSINTGAAFAQRAMGDDVFYDYLVKFGLKEKRNIDLPGEIVGSLRPLEVDPRAINFATASYGQGISTTPIGLITAVAAIANDGVMMRPYVNAEMEPLVLRRVISGKSSRQVQEMMVSAVDKAQIPAIKGYNVAGKTGTAQVPDFSSGGYTDDVINTYIGFAPAYEPEFIILVKLNKPYGAPLAGLTVVPAFRDLAQFIINYYEIPPDNVN
jgi:stage V sporulation protein D (sporulation-specific penicillin-binding protein)